jgi:chromate transport protein ChrA
MASTLSESIASNFSTMPWKYHIREMIGERNMPLTTVLITIVAAGLLLWLVNRFIPMQGQIKSILNGVVVIVLVLWIANLYGLFQHLNQFRVGK